VLVLRLAVLLVRIVVKVLVLAAGLLGILTDLSTN
jgi:hypothetical protein